MLDEGVQDVFYINGKWKSQNMVKEVNNGSLQSL